MGTDDKKIRNFETIQHFLFPDKDHKKLLKLNQTENGLFCLSDTFSKSNLGDMTDDFCEIFWTVRENNIFISND